MSVSGKMTVLKLSPTIVSLKKSFPSFFNILSSLEGNRTTPSYVAFSSEERLIGDAAKNQAAMNPRNTVFDAKRLIGRRYELSTVATFMFSNLYINHIVTVTPMSRRSSKFFLTLSMQSTHVPKYRI